MFVETKPEKYPIIGNPVHCSDIPPFKTGKCTGGFPLFPLFPLFP
ncbi:hypothetical protein HMPREF3038_00779, partial [Akkermansia sp. KLE1797]